MTATNPGDSPRADEAPKKRLPEFDEAEMCPHCKGRTETGFGLAGGGYGVYAYCPKCEAVTSKSEIAE